MKALRKAFFLGALEPDADRLLRNGVGSGGFPQGAVELDVFPSHLGSHQRSESSISVHVVRAERRWVECSSTTSLQNPSRADNLLKHDT